MKSVLYGIVLMTVISVVAWIVLDSVETGSDVRYTSANHSVRLD